MVGEVGVAATDVGRDDDILSPVRPVDIEDMGQIGVYVRQVRQPFVAVPANRLAVPPK